MPDDDKKLEIGKLKGEVRGFYGKDYTKGISPANVFVKIWIPSEEFRIISLTVVRIKKGIYDIFDEDDLARLKKEHPDKYTTLAKYVELFKMNPVDGFGQFELEVPIGNWGYIVSAYVEDKVYNHISAMGNDGTGKQEVITAERFKESKTIEGIIIPVEDKWWEPSKGQKKKDPNTDPSKIKTGLVSDDFFDRVEKHRKEREDLPVDDDEKVKV